MLGAFIAGAVTVYIWCDARITTAARNAVLNERFLGELAKQVRPTCVFNSKGVIETDLGTADYLEKIRLKFAPAVYGIEIMLDCKKHLAYAPLVTCLNADLFTVTCGSNGAQWVGLSDTSQFNRVRHNHRCSDGHQYSVPVQDRDSSLSGRSVST